MRRPGFLTLILLSLLVPALATHSAEPKFKIRLLSGSEISADKAWVQGDRLLYERYGTAGSVRMVDVLILIDRDLEDKVYTCVASVQEAEMKMRAIGQAAREMRGQSSSAGEQAAINEATRSRIQAEAQRVIEDCSAALVKHQQNKRMFDEARERARR